MITFFQCGETGERLSILGYDGSRTNNMRYRTVINDDQVAVLHLESVDTEATTPISELSLCPGVLEADMSELISQSASRVITLFLIEKAEQQIVFRSRSCRLLQPTDCPERLCKSCEEVIGGLRGGEEKEEQSKLDSEELKPEVEEMTSFSVTSSNVDVAPVVIRIMKANTEDESGVPVKQTYRKRKNKIQCPGQNCSEMFVSHLKMRRHARIEHNLAIPKKKGEEGEKTEPVNCPFCDQKFIKLSSKILTHLKCYHLDEKENPLYVEMVRRVETETRQYICQLCGKYFMNAGPLERHLRKFHESHQLQSCSVTCDQCGKGFWDKGKLSVHIMRVHSDRSKRDFLCMDCGKVLSSKANLDNHILRMHSEEKVSCPECKREFRHPNDLIRHIGQVHTARERTEQCPQCDKMFYSFNALQSHVRSVHEKLKPWYCEICPFKASRLGNLNEHRRKTHMETNISKQTLIEMVEQEKHPYYRKDDLAMIKAASSY